MAATKKERRNKMLVVVIGTFILVTLFFYFMKKDTEKAKEEAIKVEIENLLGSDIEMDYPSTPKEVIVLFNKLITCYYDEKLSDDTIKKVMAQERVLFDQELLNKNQFDDQFKDLKEEITDYRKAKRTIVGSSVGKSSSVEYYKKEGKEYASIIATYTLKDSEVTKTYQKYILRKDENGKWRILGWEITSPTDIGK
ncbi:DUF6715 family protein [Anaerosporobacter faecicola]|uniref:DUF6715 family protein n=1 Tax=Anaerosporobacter faecicola TaxID=2718714 RepID=UPI00143B5EFA|nr:DUF6715 family protein [Anaerosporobacter faecicola]